MDLTLLLAPLALLAPSSLGEGDEPDFARDIEPLLAKHCHECHGEKKQRAGLRLDRREAALAGSFNGELQVIVPGDRESELLLRLKSEDADERMPPKGPPLGALEIELFERWITAGAVWPEESGRTETEEAAWTTHWAYLGPEAPKVPPSPRGQAPLEPIDRFLRAALAERELSPAPLASRETLLRRASLDLRGLPPTLQELERYREDPEPGAWERALERLMDSPHYAEHQARLWLDLARYADSKGYEKDDRRTMWRYRDWVIEAFAEDMPFDRFSIEQLAGDLLPEPTLDQRVATGFHRNTMVNREGGTDPEEFRVAAVKDRVHTTAATWLGTTLECAQCHDHKHDPFSQRDYYAFYAFFDSTADSGNSDAPTIPAPTTVQLAAEGGLRAEKEELLVRLASFPPELEEPYLAWRAAWEEDGARWSVVRPHRTTPLESRLAVLDDGSVLALGEAPATDTYTLRLRPGPGTWRALRLEVLGDESLPAGGPGRTPHGNFVLNELRLLHGGEALALERARADFFQVDRPWRPGDTIDGDPESGWAISGGLEEAHRLLVELAQPVELAAGEELELELQQGYGSQHLIGRLAVSLARERPPEDLPVPSPAVASALGADAEEGGVRAFYRERAGELDPLRARVAEIDAALHYTEALVMQELEEPRQTHLLVRGHFLEKGEPVEPATPRILPPLRARGERPDRLDLARWLFDGRNPLTARVFVNRVWERLFGEGLVRTSADFGIQGDVPTHPELLDWLALRFRDSGWSVKELHRQIMRSHAYRQSARVTPEHLERDPLNRYLARGPRHRLDAEGVRDTALSVSGLLDPRIGGPSVFPHQPEGTWTMTYSGDRWQASEGGDRWRRGLYTFWRRTAPYPTFLLFDATSRELS